MRALSNNARIKELRKENQQLIKDAEDKHYQMAESIQSSLQKNAGIHVTVKSEVELQNTDVSDIDLCISLGGDNTFLKTAAIIKNSKKTAILGLNLGLHADP